ncbi:MAG TPA: homocysteine S-methyltransferase family protein, partial [Phycisphaerae bacterium]|nr:homocysteine S-methyltransferase family protein [Phycisphaerae bacterium]
GVALAARDVGLPVGIGLTVELDGRLPDGTPLADAIEAVDSICAPTHYGVNCAHPTHIERGMADQSPQLRRIARMLLQWDADGNWPVPVYHIHGDADRIIPFNRVQPDEVVRGGGHLINMTHADQVNRFIERHLTPCRCPETYPAN